MAIAKFKGVTPDGKEVWGDWEVEVGMKAKLIDFCRNAFLSKYKNMWIYPVYFDDKYFGDTKSFFKEVGVVLYPRITDLNKYFKDIGCEEGATIANMRKYRNEMDRLALKDLKHNGKLGTAPIYVVIKGKRVKRIFNCVVENEYSETIEVIKEVKKFRCSKGEYY